MKTFRPFAGFVLVRPSTTVSDTDNAGLILPDAAKETPLEAEVLAVGGDRPTTATGLNLLASAGLLSQCFVGETIAYAKFAGKDIALNGEKLLLLRESEILGAYVEQKEEAPLV